MKEDYIIAICNTEADGVYIERVYGTEEEVKTYLFSLVLEDREEDEGAWEDDLMNTMNVDDITKANNGELNAYNTFCNYHIDYTARPVSSMIAKNL